MVAPVPLPRQNLPPKRPEDLGDKHEDEVLLESESEASTKTSCSDSGIEDGKSSPTSEEKVWFFFCVCVSSFDITIEFFCLYSGTFSRLFSVVV